MLLAVGIWLLVRRDQKKKAARAAEAKAAELSPGDEFEWTVDGDTLTLVMPAGAKHGVARSQLRRCGDATTFGLALLRARAAVAHVFAVAADVGWWWW